MKQTCLNCKFNMDTHCNVGTYLAERGKKGICYEGELWQGKVKYYSMFGNKKKLKIAEAKLELLAHKDLTRVSAFNKWFCDDTKPREIYAHTGIYLRCDKLCEGNIRDFWQSLTKLDDDTLNDVMNEHYWIATQFQEIIRNNWMKQLHN